MTYLISAIIIIIVELIVILYSWHKLGFRMKDYNTTYKEILENGYRDYKSSGTEMLYAIINTKDEDIDDFHRGRVHERIDNFLLHRMKPAFEYNCALSELVLDITDYIGKEVKGKNEKGRPSIDSRLGHAKILFEKYESVLAYKDSYSEIIQILTVQEVINSTREKIEEYTQKLEEYTEKTSRR